MQHHVIVSFGKHAEFDFKFATNELAGRSSDEARQWFAHEFAQLECDVASPTGKVLIVDRILSVAKYAGEGRFREQAPWAEQFARHTATLLGRELIRVDVPSYAIGY